MTSLFNVITHKLVSVPLFVVDPVFVDGVVELLQ